MQRTLDLTPLQPTIRQRRILMRTRVIDREHLTIIGVEHHDRRINIHPPRITTRQGRQRTDLKHGLYLSVMVLLRITQHEA